MLCFLLETRKVLLDNLVKMHDQFIMDLLRHGKRLHEQKHRELRKRQKKAIDTILEVTNWLLGSQDDRPLFKKELWQSVNEKRLLGSVDDLHAFKRLEERGLGDILVARYPGLRKYFSEFLRLPFRAKQEQNHSWTLLFSCASLIMAKSKDCLVMSLHILFHTSYSGY